MLTGGVAMGAGLLLVAVAVVLMPHGPRRQPRNARAALHAGSRLLDVRSPYLRRLGLVGAAVGFAACGVPVLAGWTPLVALAGAVAGGVGGHLVGQGLAQRQSRADHAGEVETLHALAAELRAGSDLALAMQTASTTSRTQLAEELRMAAASVGLGADPVQVLRRRGASTPSKALASVCQIATVHGIPLASAVDVLADDATDRIDQARTLRGLLAGPNATAATLCLLPVFGVLMGESMGAGAWQLLTTSTIGGAALLGGTVLAAAGVLWTRSLAREAMA